jgi:DNA-binding Lrp family transcriptional regulator
MAFGHPAMRERAQPGIQPFSQSCILAERQSASVLAAFETAVRRCHDIVSCHLLAGQYDYILVARVAGIDDYNRLHQNELSHLPGVIRLETSFALRDVLETGRA